MGRKEGRKGDKKGREREQPARSLQQALEIRAAEYENPRGTVIFRDHLPPTKCQKSVAKRSKTFVKNGFHEV